MTYKIDGTTASLAPFSVSWQRIHLGIDHNGAPIYATKNNVICRFPAASPTFARQWIALEDGASHSINMLGPDSLSFFDLSPIYVTVVDPPEMTDIHSGEFTIMITGSSRPSV